jgi:hypothetical protein
MLHVSRHTGSFVVVTNLKFKHTFRVAAMFLFYILRKIDLNKSFVFLITLLPHQRFRFKQKLVLPSGPPHKFA